MVNHLELVVLLLFYTHHAVLIEVQPPISVNLTSKIEMNEVLGSNKVLQKGRGYKKTDSSFCFQVKYRKPRSRSHISDTYQCNAHTYSCPGYHVNHTYKMCIDPISHREAIHTFVQDSPSTGYGEFPHSYRHP